MGSKDYSSSESLMQTKHCCSAVPMLFHNSDFVHQGRSYWKHCARLLSLLHPSQRGWARQPAAQPVLGMENQILQSILLIYYNLLHRNVVQSPIQATYISTVLLPLWNPLQNTSHSLPCCKHPPDVNTSYPPLEWPHQLQIWIKGAFITADIY